MIILSQRDARWGFKPIGGSTSTIGQYGCTITSLAMLSDWYGCYHDPAWMAKYLAFQDDLVLWGSITEKTCFKFVYRYYADKHKDMLPRLEEAMAGKTTSCLLQLQNRHWVVGIKSIGWYYWVADPWTGSRRLIGKGLVSGGAVFDQKKTELGYVKGIDVSHYQGKIDWARVREDGIKFAICKCTQGLNYKDPTYDENKKGVRENGIVFGSYHFANAMDAVQEADWYLANVGDIKDGEMLVLDWEKTHANPPVWCKKFLDRVKAKTGKTPLFYSYQAKVLAITWPEICNDYPLWEARYPLNDVGVMGTPPLTGSWADWKIWQYSSKGKVDGIIGNVDMDIMKA